MMGERRQRLHPAALDPAIGSVGAAQSVGGAIVPSGQSIDLGIQKSAVQGRAGQHPFQRFAVGILIAGHGSGAEFTGGNRQSFIPGAATPCTKLRRKSTKASSEGTCTQAEAADNRRISTV